MMELDGVQLRFTDDALKTIASEAIKRNTGARGLRSILEGAMLDVMFDIPSQRGVREVVINERAILRKEPPLVVMSTGTDDEKADGKGEVFTGVGPEGGNLRPATRSIDKAIDKTG